MNFIEMIYFWARNVPHRPAIIQTEMVTTFQGLADAIDAIGERIERLNLNHNEPVAVRLTNPSFMIVTLFALMRSGYSVAPVNAPMYPHLAGAGIRNLIYDTEGQALSGGRNIRFDMSWLPSPGQKSNRTYRKISENDVSIITFTSGSTGIPKPVVRSAAALAQRLRASNIFTPGAHERVLILPGLVSAWGFNATCDMLMPGRTACFAADNMAALSLINLFGIKAIVASAAQALSLAEFKTRNPGYRTDSLDAIIVGGGKIEPEGVARIRTTLCRNLINTYGSSESGVVGCTPFEVLGDRPGAVAFPWADLEVVDETDQPLPVGAEGKVRFRTPQLLENIKEFGPDQISGVRDGWFYTDDIGSLDNAGVLHLIGRSSDVINRGGLSVSGTRIEELLKQMPEIVDAAACGVVGQSALDEIWIAVVAAGGLDTEEIKQRLRQHPDVGIAPDEVFVIDQIPRGDLGKVQKHRLKELLIDLKKGA